MLVLTVSGGLVLIALPLQLCPGSCQVALEACIPGAVTFAWPGFCTPCMHVTPLSAHDDNCLVTSECPESGLAT
jgi:hypothetical protein